MPGFHRQIAPGLIVKVDPTSLNVVLDAERAGDYLLTNVSAVAAALTDAKAFVRSAESGQRMREQLAARNAAKQGQP